MPGLRQAGDVVDLDYPPFFIDRDGALGVGDDGAVVGEDVDMALGCLQGADVAVQHEVGVVVRFMVSVTSGSAAYTRSPTWR